MYGRCDAIFGRTGYPAELDFVDHASGLDEHLATRGRAVDPPFMELPSMQQRYGLTPAAVAIYPMYRGIARLVGMEVLPKAAELDGQVAQLGEHWTARANFNWSKSKIWFKSTGLGQVNITVPASYFPARAASKIEPRTALKSD